MYLLQSYSTQLEYTVLSEIKKVTVNMQQKINPLWERDENNYEIIFFTYKGHSNKFLKDS